MAADDTRQFSRKQLDFFEQKIRPQLVKHCYACHADQAKPLRANLRLDYRAGLLKGGDSGAAVVPGQPEKSLLIEAIRYEGSQMPPNGKLPAHIIRDFETWIEQGLPDPRTEGSATKAFDKSAAVGLWSLQPVKRPVVPVPQNSTSLRNEVDAFVQSRLEAAALPPLGSAAPRTLIRRLYLDLIGRPPSPSEMSAWLDKFLAAQSSSTSSDDVAQPVLLSLVDELLSSPQFGERWGRHWLDTARYAESNGNNRNRVYRYAWRYRNWVIDAYNADQPYDRFLKEQLAGDLLPASSPQQRKQQRIATGFLAIGPKPYYPTIVPFDPEEPDRARFDWAAEQIEATTTGMLALTVGCARCHDHKFDPIPTRDYYALMGIFRSTNPRFGMYWDLFGVDEGQAQRDFLYDWNLLVLNDEILKEIRPLQDQFKPLVIEENQINLRARHWPQQIERMQEKLKNSPHLPEDQVQQLKRNIDQRSSQLAADAVRLKEVLRQKQKMRENFKFSVDQAMGVEDSPQPKDVHIRISGEHAQRGELVPRGFLSALQFAGAPASINLKQSGRLELAEWIAHPQNPLTARVEVNRVWYHLFGRGLVSSLDNFGVAGEAPTHPELLDYLADRFVHDFGWSRKRLIRYLISSRTYQLDSAETQADALHFERDPQNSLYWRMSPRRLEAEIIRDSLLAVTGQLDPSRPDGSPLVQFEYYADIRHEDRQQALALLGSRVRTIYVPTLRSHRHALYELFNYPDDESVNSARDANSVPTQALFLMNNPLMLEYAAKLAERVQQLRSTDDSIKIKNLYELAFCRTATKQELQSDMNFLAACRQSMSEAAAWRQFAHSFLISSEFLFRF